MYLSDFFRFRSLPHSFYNIYLQSRIANSLLSSRKKDVPDYKHEVFGLLAGAGSLPIEFMRKLGDNGIKETAVLGFKCHTPDEVREKATHYQEIGFGQLGKGIKFFKGLIYSSN